MNLTGQGVTYKVSLSKFQKIVAENSRSEIYEYSLQYTNTSSNNITNREGFIWNSSEASIAYMEFVSDNISRATLKDIGLKIALSLRTF